MLSVIVKRYELLCERALYICKLLLLLLLLLFCKLLILLLSLYTRMLSAMLYPSKNSKQNQQTL